MNMQNKLYPIQFFSPPDDRFVTDPEQQLQSPKIPNFLKKFELRDKRGFELPETRRADSSLPPSQPPFINCAWHLWYGIFPLVSLG